MFAYKVLVDDPRTVDEAAGAQSMRANEQLDEVLVRHSHLTTVHHNHSTAQTAISRYQCTDESRFNI